MEGNGGMMCLKRGMMCLQNVEGDGKHFPAWPTNRHTDGETHLTSTKV